MPGDRIDTMEPAIYTVEVGTHVYLTPLGEIHVDRELDEITLMRLIAAATQINTEWRWVRQARIGLTMIGLEVLDHDDGRAVIEGDDFVARWFWATA